jgi:hypothetical protein
MKIDEIKNIIKEEKSNLSALGVKKVGIFGSFIRGEAGPESDIDILLDISTDSTLTLFSLADIEIRLSEKLNRKVDLVIKKDLKPQIGKKILSEVQYV